MEITGIYQAQKDLIEDLKRANELLKKEINELQKDKEYSNEQYTKVSLALESKHADYKKLFEQYMLVCDELESRHLQQNTYSEWNINSEFEENDGDEVKQEYTPAVIELTRQQVYHLMDFIEDNGTVDSVVLKVSNESGIGPTITAKATVEIDLTDHSTW